MAISPQRVIRYTSCLVLGYRSADRMALFLVTSNPRWRQVAVLGNLKLISNGHISTTAHSIHLHSTYRAVIFAIAQLSSVLCLSKREYLESYNRKSRIWALTLDDLKLLQDQILLEFHDISRVAITAKRMKIDPYCQRRNCSPGLLQQ